MPWTIWTLNKNAPCCRTETTTGGYITSKSYAKMKHCVEEVFRRKAAGDIKQEIDKRLGIGEFFSSLKFYPTTRLSRNFCLQQKRNPTGLRFFVYNFFIFLLHSCH